MNEEINKTYNSLPEEEKEQLNLFEKKGITEIKADQIRKNAQIDAKQTVNELKQEAEKEIKERKQEYANLESDPYKDFGDEVVLSDDDLPF